MYIGASHGCLAIGRARIPVDEILGQVNEQLPADALVSVHVAHILEHRLHQAPLQK